MSRTVKSYKAKACYDEVTQAIHAAHAANVGAIVSSREGEESWRTGTIVETLAPSAPTFSYDGAQAFRDLSDRLSAS